MSNFNIKHTNSVWWVKTIWFKIQHRASKLLSWTQRTILYFVIKSVCLVLGISFLLLNVSRVFFLFAYNLLYHRISFRLIYFTLISRHSIRQAVAICGMIQIPKFCLFITNWEVHREYHCFGCKQHILTDLFHLK